MNEQQNLKVPPAVNEILSETAAIGFQMVSEPLAGSLLRTLAASKPSGNFLELGTGTGVSTAWLLDGMDKTSQLISVENDAAVVSIAQKYLGQDQRLTLRVEDAGAFVESLGRSNQKFDLIFADTWAGKYTHLEEVLCILKPGGFYVIDDMLPQTNWSKDHDLKVAALVTELDNRSDLTITKLNWASGIIVATKL
ncbi:MAG: class I SAM-dependent methyltransferase [Oscillatoriophycideae cyanobacterium NC_groundwater_1537_Pr4_S-0.65um_50_18]|nr:class I SAM-dependent methyltransferase [Oscillatoriophycideae cyanobacterium NC_groundwater_1537_Pr4_S-0.65um_50_18]